VSNRTAIISTIIPYPVEVEENSTKFVVSNPPNIVDITSGNFFFILFFYLYFSSISIKLTFILTIF
jgi:hypothetical protein